MCIAAAISAAIAIAPTTASMSNLRVSFISRPPPRDKSLKIPTASIGIVPLPAEKLQVLRPWLSIPFRRMNWREYATPPLEGRCLGFHPLSQREGRFWVFVSFLGV